MKNLSHSIKSIQPSRRMNLLLVFCIQTKSKVASFLFKREHNPAVKQYMYVPTIKVADWRMLTKTPGCLMVRLMDDNSLFRAVRVSAQHGGFSVSAYLIKVSWDQKNV